MSILELRHYTIRFRESERLRYRLPRLAWLFLIRASDAQVRAANSWARAPDPESPGACPFLERSRGEQGSSLFDRNSEAISAGGAARPTSSEQPATASTPVSG